MIHVITWGRGLKKPRKNVENECYSPGARELLSIQLQTTQFAMIMQSLTEFINFSFICLFSSPEIPMWGS